MRKRPRNSADGRKRLLLLASKLAQAVDVRPRSRTKVTRDFFGYAVTMPTSAESMHWLGAVIEWIACGEALDDALHEPRRAGRPNKLLEPAKQFAILCAKGMTDDKAAKIAGGNAVTLRRYVRKQLASNRLNSFRLFLFSELSGAEITECRRRFGKTRIPS